MGFGGPVSLSICAIKIVMDMYEVQEQKKMLNIIINTWNHFLILAKEKEGK